MISEIITLYIHPMSKFQLSRLHSYWEGQNHGMMDRVNLLVATPFFQGG